MKKKVQKIEKKNEQKSPPKIEKSSKSQLLTLFLIVFLDMVGLSIVIPILAPLFLATGPQGILSEGVTFAMRTLLLGLLIASYPFAQFFGSPILGALSDRHGRKKILLISLAGTLVGYVIFAIGIMTHNLLLLFASRILDGFTGGNISVAFSAIADTTDEKSRAKNFGLIGMAFGLGFIIGPFIGGRLSDPSLVHWFSFATPLWFAALLAAINIILVIMLFKETLRTRLHTKVTLATGPRNVINAFKLYNLRVLFLFMFLIILGFNFFTQFFSVFLIEKFSYTQVEIGNMFGFIGVCIALTQGGLIRLIAPRVSQKKLIVACGILLATAIFFLIIPTKSWMIFCILPFVAFSFGLLSPTSIAMVSAHGTKESQGEILGINQSVQSLAQTIPPVIAGVVASISPSLPILIASTILLIAWGVFLIFIVAKPHREAKFKEV